MIFLAFFSIPDELTNPFQVYHFYLIRPGVKRMRKIEISPDLGCDLEKVANNMRIFQYKKYNSGPCTSNVLSLTSQPYRHGRKTGPIPD